MRIVIDTNVLISGIIFGGKPSKIIELLFGKKISVFASPEMVDEYKRIYGELGERYAKRTHNELNEIINSMNILPSHSHIEACRDPDDNKFIECAIDNRCIYIVSGDKDLLVLEQYEDIGILTVSEFLEQYEKKRHKNSTKN
ncbi:MAG: putative toxin-antitoxin system toxin component, PIN family [Bacteroidales bacterium]|jgi:putative PIN family toxin of toxin-antitoxin system|nr:putative toxin-antitoxin system toxin component, PIN family [Paludibacteraceae bacterium]MCR5246603.1 putative toxin-antitoxin system toxin component, PIN family [Paludibacteraceae bacterium]MDO4524326.1 putative toxin-antitoxin system toxin component, PIN family [Bacteroidales bacterium]MEE0084911.1 putative toxin-antitoxin system toxin component, PIN family [Paludibacteraceae bacterium]MEE1260987.1 putative toxin-antitoxin system toxin component, PIN family [Paludibacteraceae bacterium]